MKKKLLYLLGIGVVGICIYDIYKYLKNYKPENFDDEEIFDDDDFVDWDDLDDFIDKEDK